MTDTFNWRGLSGSSHTYHIKPLPWQPSEGQDGNYIFAKMVNGVWHAVYIGEGVLRQRYDAAHHEGCVTERGATHYHVHMNSNKAARKQEESDLIAGNSECQWPNGCNGHD